MLEQVRTFFGRLRGMHGDRKAIVNQTTMWRCKNCHMLFVTKEAGEQHKCLEQNVN
jgi:hypothetical protein